MGRVFRENENKGCVIVIGSSVVAQSGLIKTISNNSSSASSPSARSLCDEACGYNIAPVCGSDGKTHDNECWMRKEGCKTGLSIRRLHDGPCSILKNLYLNIYD